MTSKMEIKNTYLWKEKNLKIVEHLLLSDEYHLILNYMFFFYFTPT